MSVSYIPLVSISSLPSAMQTTTLGPSAVVGDAARALVCMISPLRYTPGTVPRDRLTEGRAILSLDRNVSRQSIVATAPSERSQVILFPIPWGYLSNCPPVVTDVTLISHCVPMGRQWVPRVVLLVLIVRDIQCEELTDEENWRDPWENQKGEIDVGAILGALK
eukprot:804817-Amorphochlora_amoeboformis.AAC.1